VCVSRVSYQVVGVVGLALKINRAFSVVGLATTTSFSLSLSPLVMVSLMIAFVEQTGD
jgi:hypothetical protein